MVTFREALKGALIAALFKNNQELNCLTDIDNFNRVGNKIHIIYRFEMLKQRETCLFNGFIMGLICWKE